MKEAQELSEPTEQYYAHPLEDNLFEWHFTIRGPEDSEFDSGLYHGRIVLPPEYPMKPPSIILLTPNGRFETHKKICLSISGHHPESWQPSWSIRTALLAIIGFMPTHGNGAIGSLDYTPEERKRLARKSQDYKCPVCGCLKSVLLPLTAASKETTKEARELAQQIDFKGEKEKSKSESKEPDSSPQAPPPQAPEAMPPMNPPPFPPFMMAPGQLPPNFMFPPGMQGQFMQGWPPNPNMMPGQFPGQLPANVPGQTNQNVNGASEQTGPSQTDLSNENGNTNTGVDNSAEENNTQNNSASDNNPEPANTGTSELRQRHNVPRPEPIPAPPNTNATLPPQLNTNNTGNGSFFLMVLLAIALTILVARRVFMHSDQWNFDFKL